MKGDFFNKLETLILALEGKDRIEYDQKVELFRLHNTQYKVKENNMSCNACVVRVYRKMKEMYKNLKDKR